MKNSIANIHRQDSNEKPSQVTDYYWLYVRRMTGIYPRSTARSGKWLIFDHIAKIDNTWNF